MLSNLIFSWKFSILFNEIIYVIFNFLGIWQSLMLFLLVPKILKLFWWRLFSSILFFIFFNHLLHFLWCDFLRLLLIVNLFLLDHKILKFFRWRFFTAILFFIFFLHFFYFIYLLNYWLQKIFAILFLLVPKFLKFLCWRFFSAILFFIFFNHIFHLLLFNCRQNFLVMIYSPYIQKFFKFLCIWCFTENFFVFLYHLIYFNLWNFFNLLI